MPDRNAWKERWNTENTPWVYPEANQDFFRDYEKLHKRLSFGKDVLVPLCGNSPVLRFLYDQGHCVVGVEYVREAILRACSELFPELAFRESAGRFSAEGITLEERDIFEFCSTTPFDFCYDRGSLVALEPKDRSRYAKVITEALKPNALFYAVLVSYDGKPDIPFPITDQEAQELFSAFDLLESSSKKNLEPAPRLKERGITEVEIITTLFRKR